MGIFDARPTLIWVFSCASFPHMGVFLSVLPHMGILMRVLSLYGYFHARSTPIWVFSCAPYPYMGIFMRVLSLYGYFLCARCRQSRSFAKSALLGRKGHHAMVEAMHQSFLLVHQKQILNGLNCKGSLVRFRKLSQAK